MSSCMSGPLDAIIRMERHASRALGVVVTSQPLSLRSFLWITHVGLYSLVGFCCTVFTASLAVHFPFHLGHSLVHNQMPVFP
jgi:hypothetical protein